MNIDLRLFIPIITPIVGVLLLRLLAFVAGVEYDDHMATGAFMFGGFIGIMIGFAIMSYCFFEEVPLGHLHIGTSGIRIIPAGTSS